MIELSPQELQNLKIKEPSVFLLDVREQAEYELCHIQGAKLIPGRDLPQYLHELPADSAIVVICHHGMRSYMAGAYLEQHGFDHVYNLKGGINAWARDIDPDMPTY